MQIHFMLPTDRLIGCSSSQSCCLTPEALFSCLWSGRVRGPAAPAVRPERHHLPGRTESRTGWEHPTLTADCQDDGFKWRTASQRPPSVRGEPQTAAGRTDGRTARCPLRTHYITDTPRSRGTGAARSDGCCPGGNSEPEPRTGRRGGCSSGLPAANQPAQEIKQSRLMRIKPVIIKAREIRAGTWPSEASCSSSPPLDSHNEPLGRQQSSAAPAASCRSAAIPQHKKADSRRTSQTAAAAAGRCPSAGRWVRCEPLPLRLVSGLKWRRC